MCVCVCVLQTVLFVEFVLTCTDIHFQYNGFLSGLLLLSIVRMYEVGSTSRIVESHPLVVSVVVAAAVTGVICFMVCFVFKFARLILSWIFLNKHFVSFIFFFLINKFRYVFCEFYGFFLKIKFVIRVFLHVLSWILFQLKFSVW